MKKRGLVILYLTLAYLFFFAPTLKRTIILESGNDAQRFGYPVRVYLSEQMQSGRFPFWTERMLSGYPIYADTEAGYLNPINVFAVYIFGPYTSYKVIHYFAYLLGSVCFFQFAHKYLKSRLGLGVAQFVYFFSFFSLYHQQHFAITLAYYLVPCCLYALDKFTTTQKLWSGHLYFGTLLFLLYFGAFQMSLIILLMSICYLVTKKASIKKVLVKGIVPALVFLCLLISLFVSYPKLYSQSTRALLQDAWLQGSFSPQVTLNLLYPFVYRSGDNYMGVILNRDFFMHEVYIYAGFSTFILGIFGLLLSKLDKELNRFLIVLIILFGIVGFAGANPLLVHIYPPIIGLFRYWGRLACLAILCLAFYSAHFIDQLGSKGFTLRLRRKNLYFLLCCAIYLLLLEVAKFPHPESLNLLRLIARADYRFDYLVPYGVFVALTVILLASVLIKRAVRYTKYALFVLPILEIAYFGTVVLKSAFVPIPKMPAALTNLEAVYSNQRIIVTDADVYGNKTLYYNFWSPFGYVSSVNKDYEAAFISIGFESSRRPILQENVSSGYKDAKLQTGLKNLGITAVTDSAGKIFYSAGSDSLFYTEAQEISTTISETHRGEGFYTLKIASTVDNADIKSYVKYDPNWQVTANGVSLKTVKTGLFLGFSVNNGVSEVEVEYIPHPLYLSFVVSFLFIILIYFVRFVLTTCL